MVRNDKIGDFMLAWPSFAMLKASLPKCHVAALVPAYTQELAELCPWIDEVIVDSGKGGGRKAQKELISNLKEKKFCASINLFSDAYNALLVWRARIPYRLAPATKLAQIFYNRRVVQRRSRSEKPEFEYNLDLIRWFLEDLKAKVVEPHGPYLCFEKEALKKQKDKLSRELGMDPEKRWVFVHIGTGGSATNLSLEQYGDLIMGLDGVFDVVLTAGPGEENMAQALCGDLEKKGHPSFVYSKNQGLADFACSLSCASLFVAGSTGPLHMAAAADVPTVGFFPAKRSATPLRWRSLNSGGRHLAFSPTPLDGDAMDMSRIDVREALQKINPWAMSYLS